MKPHSSIQLTVAGNRGWQITCILALFLLSSILAKAQDTNSGSNNVGTITIKKPASKKLTIDTAVISTPIDWNRYSGYYTYRSAFGRNPFLTTKKKYYYWKKGFPFFVSVYRQYRCCSIRFL